jgi:NADH:ubiquinone oxidoreductase subunit F (NADH-binding)
MGSGGMIVVDEDTCMVEFARYFLTFASAESCGKCVPCRIGGQRLLEALMRITEGKGALKTWKRLTISPQHERGVAVRFGAAHSRSGNGFLRFFRRSLLRTFTINAARRKSAKG